MRNSIKNKLLNTLFAIKLILIILNKKTFYLKQTKSNYIHTICIPV